jgi:hypothetical protein
MPSLLKIILGACLMIGTVTLILRLGRAQEKARRNAEDMKNAESEAIKTVARKE